jgi:hypothetical protein
MDGTIAAPLKNNEESPFHLFVRVRATGAHGWRLVF